MAVVAASTSSSSTMTNKQRFAPSRTMSDLSKESDDHAVNSIDDDDDDSSDEDSASPANLLLPKQLQAASPNNVRDPFQKKKKKGSPLSLSAMLESNKTSRLEPDYDDDCTTIVYRQADDDEATVISRADAADGSSQPSSIPSPPQSFEAVSISFLSSSVPPHTAERCLEEAMRIVNGGGYLYVIDYQGSTVKKLPERFRSLLSPIQEPFDQCAAHAGVEQEISKIVGGMGRTDCFPSPKIQRWIGKVPEKSTGQQVFVVSC